MSKASIRAVVATLLLLAATRLNASDPELELLKTPSLDALQSSKDANGFDDQKSDVLQWMQRLEAFLATERWEYSVEADVAIVGSVSGEARMISQKFAFKVARSPELSSERYIYVGQSTEGNEEIALNEGIAIDQRRHLDLLRVNDRVYVSRVTTWGENVTEAEYEGKFHEWKKRLRTKMFFDPCHAAVADTLQIVAGYAQRFRDHTVLPETISGIITDTVGTHVLLHIGKRPRQVQQLITFRDEVPVQLFHWSGVRSAEKVGPVTSIVRSHWTEVKDGLRLPTAISSERHSSGCHGALEKGPPVGASGPF